MIVKIVNKDNHYGTESGNNVRIYATDGIGGWPVHGAVELEAGWEQVRWRLNGHRLLDQYHRYDLVEIGQYDHIQIDDPVWAKMIGHDPYLMHFAGIDSDGNPQTYMSGQTSWTGACKSSWDFCAKASHKPGEEDSDVMYEHIGIDDPVIVIGADGETYRRHFAGVGQDGRPQAYLNGHTSWTTDGKSSWDKCEKGSYKDIYK